MVKGDRRESGGIGGRLGPQNMRDNIAGSRAEPVAKLCELSMLSVVKRRDARLCKDGRFFAIDMETGFKRSCQCYLQLGYQGIVRDIAEVAFHRVRMRDGGQPWAML